MFSQGATQCFVWGRGALTVGGVVPKLWVLWGLKNHWTYERVRGRLSREEGNRSLSCTPKTVFGLEKIYAVRVDNVRLQTTPSVNHALEKKRRRCSLISNPVRSGQCLAVSAWQIWLGQIWLTDFRCTLKLALQAQYMLRHIRPSVGPPHYSIVSKRRNAEGCVLQHWVVKCL